MPITICCSEEPHKDAKPEPLVVFATKRGRVKSAQALSAKANNLLRSAVAHKDDATLREIARSLTNIKARHEKRIDLDKILEAQ